MIGQLGALVGKSEIASSLIYQYKNDIEEIVKSNQNKVRPKIYFEEWFDPLISGICWVSELIELAGGIDVYKENQTATLAKDRIIKDADDVVERNPDIIIASWCGKGFKNDKLISRKNWNKINAVKNDFVFEIKSSIILQPGTAAVTDGINQMSNIVAKWHLFRNTSKS